MSEINPGVWDGLTPDQARKYYPEEWDRFTKDPYSFRAPRAESYHDLSGASMFLHRRQYIGVEEGVALWLCVACSAT